MKKIGGMPQIAALLSFNGGFIDTAGFLGLHGLFSAHVTGNFVTLGAALVFGTHGIVGKLLALPEFILVIALARLAGTALRARQAPALRVMLAATTVLLLAFFLLGVCYGPFSNPDSPIALLTGFSAVAAMAVQNGLQRVHLTHLPTTTIMTGNSTQFSVDLVDLLLGPRAARTPEMRLRFIRLATAMGAFVVGCAASAFLYWLWGFWSLALPVVVAAVAAALPLGARALRNSADGMVNRADAAIIGPMNNAPKEMRRRVNGVAAFIFVLSLAGPATAQMYNPEPKTTMADVDPGVDHTARDVDLPPELRRQSVFYRTDYPPGTIIVNTNDRFLYLILGNNVALRYGIGVGRDGFQWGGIHKISRKAEWPDWTPPPEMIARQPYLPRWMAGGPGNPMGARALYIGTTVYRIHGTNAPETIGQAVSSGCFRLVNDDIADLYGRVPVGTKVVVQHQ